METKTRRIGGRMLSAADVVNRQPGISGLGLARLVGPHGSRRYGYAIMHRALAAGLIVRGPVPPGGSGKYYLFPPKAAR